MRGELLTGLSASWSSVTGHQSNQILVSLNEVDPGSHMEAGMILPSLVKSPFGRTNTTANSTRFTTASSRNTSSFSHQLGLAGPSDGVPVSSAQKLVQDQ